MSVLLQNTNKPEIHGKCQEPRKPKVGETPGLSIKDTESQLFKCNTHEHGDNLSNTSSKLRISILLTGQLTWKK
jgi:hypothetical protein